MRSVTPCFLVPPYVARNLATYSETPEARAAAVRSALAAADLRRRRARLAPVPGEPDEGERRRVVDAQGKERETGPVLREEDSSPGTDDAANLLYDGLGNYYRFLFEVFGRRSWDGTSGLMLAVARYGMEDNAAWTGDAYVSGVGRFFNAMESDATVMGHEGTHALDQYCRNIGPYFGQAGAIKEGPIADFGAMLSEQYVRHQSAAEADWLVGRLLCEGKVQRGKAHPERPAALRDPLYPGDAYDDPVLKQDPQPADMDGYVSGAEDNGGVHINCSIPTRALVTASIALGGNAWETMGKVWWDVLSVRLAPASPTFAQYAAASLDSADAIFGSTSRERHALADGWDLVKIAPEAAPPPAPASPCQPELDAILRDPEAMAHLHALAKDHGLDVARLLRGGGDLDLFAHLSALLRLRSVRRFGARALKG